MKNEQVADLMLSLKDEDMPEGLPEYSYHELGYLLNILWDVEDKKCQDIRSALVTCCLKPNWFWKALKYEHASPVKWIFKYPFIDLPLLTNRRAKYIKIVTKWRLEIGK